MTTDVDVQEIEWRFLNKLLIPQNRDYINRVSSALLTGTRISVFQAMQKAFQKYGIITYEGIDYFMHGNVPGQLTAATNGDLTTLLDQLARLAKKRQLKTIGKQLLELSEDYDPSDEAIQLLMDIDPVIADEDSGLGLGAQSFLADLAAKRSGQYVFARTGFRTLDRQMGGEWKPRGLVLIAGGVGSGKTTLWLNSQKAMAKGYIASATGQLIQTPSLFISLEMAKEELIAKHIADELSIDSNEIASFNFVTAYDRPEGESEWNTDDDIIRAIEDKLVDLQQLPMYVIDNGQLTLANIVYQIRKHVKQHGVRVVCIDYLQLINHHPTGNDNNDLGEIGIVLKALAKKENITIIVLSQINRAGEGVDIIRGSGEVQAAADVIMQLVADPDDIGSVTNIHIAWHKNRGGKAGRKTPLLLHGPFQRFVETS